MESSALLVQFTTLRCTFSNNRKKCNRVQTQSICLFKQNCRDCDVHTFCTLPCTHATRSEERFLCWESNESGSLWVDRQSNACLLGREGLQPFLAPPTPALSLCSFHNDTQPSWASPSYARRLMLNWRQRTPSTACSISET